MDARAFKILKALLGCGRSPDKAETTGPNQKQTKSEADIEPLPSKIKV
jgi:hypothetical protein